MKFLRISLGIAATASVFVAYSQTNRHVVPEAAYAASNEVRQREPRNLDEHFIELAQTEIPGFGGYFIDDDGELVIYLKDLRGRDRAVAAIGRALQRRPPAVRDRGRGLDVARARILQGRFDFIELASWKSLLTERVTRVPELVFVDANEERNQVLIGVASEDARSAVVQIVETLGLPDDAVAIEIVEPSLRTSGLNSSFRPTIGGIGIAWRSAIDNRLYGCSIGFNTVYQADNSPAFVTASHCSDHVARVDGRRYHQPPRETSANLIGTEAQDPTFITSADSPTTCPSWPGRCRYSDALIVKYAPGVEHSIGFIARTRWNDTIINASSPRFRIVEEVGFPVGGETIDRMGAATGWRGGKVTETCINVWGEGDYVFLCQDRVTGRENTTEARTIVGDSGGPAFSWTSGDRARLYGIVWSGGNNHFTFSSLSNLRMDGLSFGRTIAQ
jgi:hypothetical protein